MPEQRNPYRGRRPWLRLGFRAFDGAVRHFDLVADTGSAAGVILRPELAESLFFLSLPPRNSNFGRMTSGLVQLYCPELEIVETIVGYGSAEAVELATRSHPDFVGLVGLPVLRIGKYGGNADEFWFRYPPS